MLRQPWLPFGLLVAGARSSGHVTVTNPDYRMGLDVTVAEASQGKVRAFGRVWSFDGRSAEVCSIDWKGP